MQRPQMGVTPGAAPATMVGFALAYVAFGYVGRTTVVDGTTFALVWPAAGVAVLWLLVRRARPLSPDTLLLAGCTYAVNTLTGAPPLVGVLLVVTNLLQALVAVALVRRWCPELWGSGGARPLDRPLVLARYVAAAALGTAGAALLGSLVLAARDGGVDDVGGVLWFGRNLCGVLLVTTPGLLVGARLASAGPRPPLLPSGPARRAELAAAGLATGAVYALAFTFSDLPLAFPLLAATVWVALRFPTLLSAGHSVLLGVATVALTLVGVGPFAVVGNPELGALLAQFFVATVLATALAISTGRDERRALEDALRGTQEQAVYEASLRDAIIGSMAEGVMVLDDRGAVLVSNGGAGLLSGAASVAEPARLALRGESVRDLEVRVTLPSEGERMLAVSAMPLPRDAARDRARALVLCRDVTEEHAHREELAAFAGVVAHDLRNPLAAVDGWTALIAEQLESGELRPELAGELVARVRSSTGRMRELIADLLAHASSRSREVTLVPVDVASLVADVAQARQAAGLVSCGRIPSVLGDPVLVRQVVDNLVGNALKYVPPGEEPAVEVTGRDGGDLVTICVADRGIGLPAGEHERIFEEFHRGQQPGYEGTGLGLSICRRIVSRHGGTIVARDNPAGRGTVVEFTLPAYAAAVGTPELYAQVG